MLNKTNVKNFRNWKSLFWKYSRHPVQQISCRLSLDCLAMQLFSHTSLRGFCTAYKQLWIKQVNVLHTFPYVVLVKGVQFQSRVFHRSFNAVSRKFRWCFEGDVRAFKESFNAVSRKFQGCFKKVSRVLQESFKGVSRKFQGCFKELSRMFQGTFKGVSRVFQGNV